MSDPTQNQNVLIAEEQALFDQFLALPARQRQLYLRLLHQWDQAPPERRALALKLLNAGLSGKEVARLVGKSDRQLRRYRQYRNFARRLREPGSPPPRGAKGREGELEAWGGEE